MQRIDLITQLKKELEILESTPFEKTVGISKKQFAFRLIVGCLIMIAIIIFTNLN